MSAVGQTPILRPRRRRGHHVGRKLAVSALRPAPAGVVPTDVAPELGMREPESARGAILSGSIATLVHAGVIAALFLFAWLAPEVIEEQLIPVTIFNEPVELPGSNDPAPVAPKSLDARAPASAAALAAALAATPVAETAPKQAADLSARAIDMQQLNTARAPTQIDRRQLQAARVEARSIDAAELAPTRLDVATLSPTRVTPTEIAAPRVQTSAPRAIDTRAPTALAAPQAFADYQNIERREYAGRAADARASVRGATTTSTASVGIDTTVSGAFLGGSGSGAGTGGVPGTVACMESAYVVRYLSLIESRTEERWQYPDGTKPNSVVKIRFQLDVTGTPTRVEFVEASDPGLGRTAVEALRSAAPFPPMDDNVRCMAEWVLTATLTANASS